MKIKARTFTHKGGTKSYTLVWVDTGRGTHSVIRRWGKFETVGQSKISRFISHDEAQSDYHRETETRKSGKKGYVITDAYDVTGENAVSVLIDQATNADHDVDVEYLLDEKFIADLKSIGVFANKSAAPVTKKSVERGEIWGSW